MFTYEMPTKLYFGKGCVAQSVADMAALGKKALIVTGRSSAKRNGSQDAVVAVLESAGLGWVLFDEVEANPSVETVRNGAELGRKEQVDFVIGIGGGSPMDAAKVIALLCTNDLDDEMLFTGPYGAPPLPIVTVPTTSGTGSEVTNISIAELVSLHTKMGLADDAIVADDAVLVPELLKGLPFKFYACSAIDALVHATESFVSPKSNPYTEALGKEAMRIIINVFKGIAEKGPDYRFEHLGEMLMASNFAGIAFGNTGVGAVHALSYPLGGNYHVPHGEANYQFYTAIFHLYNKKNPNGRIQELNAYLQQLLGTTGDPYDALDELLGKLIKKNPLHTYGMKEEEIAGFAKNVLETQQRLLNNNYVPLSEEEIREVYRELF